MAHNPEHTRLRGASGLLPLTEEEKRELLASEGIYDEELGSDVSYGGESANIAPYLHPNMAANYPGSSPSAVAAREGFSTFPRGTAAAAPLNLQGIQHNVVADAAKKANQYALQTAVQDRKINQAAHQSDMTSLLMSLATGQRISSYGTSLRSGTSNTASNLAHQRRLKNAAISKGLVSIIDKYSDQIKSKKDVENLILAIPGLDINQRKDLRTELNEWKEEDFKPMTAFVDGKIKVLFRRPGDLNKKEREAGYTFDMTITNALKGQGEAEMVGNALNKFSTYFSALPESERTRRKMLTWTAREGYYRNPVVMSAIKDLVGDLVPEPKYEVRYFRDEKGVFNQRTVSSEAPLKKGEVRSLDYAKRTAKTLHQVMMDELIKAQGSNTLAEMLDLYRIRVAENPGRMALLEGTVADREQAFLNMMTAARTEAAGIVKTEADSIEAAAAVLTGGEFFSYKLADDGKTVITNPRHSDHASRDWLTKRLTKKQLLADAQSGNPEYTPEKGYFTREGAEKVSTWDNEGRRVDAVKDVHGNILQPSVATQEGYGTLVYLEAGKEGTPQEGANIYKEFHYSNPAMKAKEQARLINDVKIDPTTLFEKGSAQDRYTPNDAHEWYYAKVPSVVDTTTTDPDTGAITVVGGRPDSWEKRYTTKFATTHLKGSFKDQIGEVKKNWEGVDAAIDKIRALIELESELVDIGVLDAQLITLWKKIDDKSMVTSQEFQTIKDAASFQAGMKRSYDAIQTGAQLTYGQRLAILLSAQLVMISATDKYRSRLRDANANLSEYYPLAPSPTGTIPNYIDLMAPGIMREFERIDKSLGYMDPGKDVSLPILDRMVRNDVINDRNRAVLSKVYKGKDGAWGAKLTKQVRDTRGKLTTVPTTRPEKVQGF